MENFISKIITNKQTCIFISPHLDDAILSAGGLLSSLSGKTKIIVINVFTKSVDDKPTLSAWKYVKAMRYKKAKKLYEDRRKEDKKAFAQINITPINLGFTEALWRKKTGMIANTLGKLLPEFCSIYPIYRLHITAGKIAKADEKIMAEITKQITVIITQEKDPVIFAPLGIGKHVDHCIVRKICANAFGKKVIYWSDFPYNVRENNFGTPPLGYKKEAFSYNILKKNTLITFYKTQITGLFNGTDIPMHKEIFFLAEGENYP